MAFRLFVDSTTGVSLCPEWDYREPLVKEENRHATPVGFSTVYNYGETARLRFSVRHVSSETAALVNSWWISNTALLFMEEGATEVFSCRLLGKLPISKLEKPYSFSLSGVIELGAY